MKKTFLALLAALFIMPAVLRAEDATTMPANTAPAATSAPATPAKKDASKPMKKHSMKKKAAASTTAPVAK